jgi:hypothetical protein
MTFSENAAGPDNYAKAAMEYFGATEELANLAGQHGKFE